MDRSSIEMELQEWEFLSDNNFFNYQAVEEDSSPESDEQHRVLAQIYLDVTTEEDPDDVVVKEIIEENDVIPEVNFMRLEESKGSGEVEFEKTEVFEGEDLELEIVGSLLFKEDEVEEGRENAGSEIDGKDCLNGFSSSVWKWRLRGIGVVSSIGLAAATLSMLILGGQQRKQNQKLQIQMYADDKKIKEGVQ